MKVTMVSFSDAHHGGAVAAAQRLRGGLLTAGVDAPLLVQRKYGDDPSVLEPHGRIARAAARLRPRIDRLPLLRYPHRDPAMFSVQWLPDSMGRRIEETEPDIIHLHTFFLGAMRLETLASLRQPVVWTMHDVWPFTGGCHVPGSCERYTEACGCCPLLHSNREGDLSHRTWERKRRAWAGSSFTLVAPSHWMADCARKSSLFRDREVTVIPHGIDLDTFQPGDRDAARHALGLPHDGSLVLFVAPHDVHDPNKGFPHLREALTRLAASNPRLVTGLVVAGGHQPPGDLPVPVHHLGHVEGEPGMARVYTACDVVAVPSRQESFGFAAAEAHACGRPVVGFAATGLLDIVEHERSGYLATPYGGGALAEGLAWVLQDRERYASLSRFARTRAQEHWHLKHQADQYVTLFRSLMK